MNLNQVTLPASEVECSAAFYRLLGFRQIVSNLPSHARLHALGVVFDAPSKDQPWLWREAYLRYPHGNVSCLYHAGSYRRFPPWRIGNSDDNPQV